jgi:hypothetical protein
MTKNKEYVYFRDGNNLIMIWIADPKNKYKSKKVIDICPEDLKLIDIDLDFNNCIVYGLTENGDIFGRSFFLKPFYSPVNFVYSGEKSKTFFNKKSKNQDTFVSISLSRNCRWLVISSSRQVQESSENYLKVYSLNKPQKTDDKVSTAVQNFEPKLISQTEFTTDWKGSKYTFI